MSETKLDPRVCRVLKPETTAVIVIDMMDAYCNPAQPLPQCMKKKFGVNFSELDIVANKIVDFLKVSRKYPMGLTIFVRMVERPEYLPQNIALKMEIEGYPPVAKINGQGWSYYKVQPQSGDLEIVKYRYDAFLGTDLDEKLKSRKIKTVVIIGGHASVCVDTTARTAAQLGYHTFVPADLTANPGLPDIPQTPDFIRKQLDTINSVLGYMPLSSTIIKVWDENKY